MSSFWEPRVQSVLHLYFHPFAVDKAADEDRNCCSPLNDKLVKYCVIIRSLVLVKIKKQETTVMSITLASTTSRTKNISRINVA